MSEPATPPSNEDAPPSRGRQVAVYAALAATVVLALLLVISTGIRWMLQPTPSSILIIHGTPQLDGASVTVIGGAGAEARRTTITAEHDFTTPLFLESGTYSIRVEKEGRLIFGSDRPLYVSNGRRYDIDLTKPANRPR